MLLAGSAQMDLSLHSRGQTFRTEFIRDGSDTPKLALAWLAAPLSAWISQPHVKTSGYEALLPPAGSAKGACYLKPGATPQEIVRQI